MTIDVVQATADRLPLLAVTLGRAFTDDPMVLWTFGAKADRAERLAAYFRVLDEPYVELGMLWEAGDGAGVALWVPAGATAQMAEAEAVSLVERRAMAEDGAREDVFWPWVQSKIPDDRLWFLDHIGVDPAGQGGGVGGALVAFGLARARADGAGAWLETGVERNVSFYERFGFRVVDDDDAPDGGPHIWFMRWDP